MPAPSAQMTAQGSPRSRFARAVKTRNAFLAEVALREMGNPTLREALDYLDRLAEVKAPKLEAAAVRWHGRLELEVRVVTPKRVPAGSRRPHGALRRRP
jgi:hypothetical protein